MQWLFYMIMQTVCVVQRLHMKDMVYWFKSGSIYSLCGSFPPFLPSLSIRWLSLAPFLIHPVNLFSFLPLAVCLHLYISFSHSLVFAPALLPSLRVSFSFLPYSFLRHFFFQFSTSVPALVCSFVSQDFSSVWSHLSLSLLIDWLTLLSVCLACVVY